MTLDVWLVARLALELRDRLTGARIQSVAADASGLRLYLYRRGGPLVLHATFDPDGPLLAVRAEKGVGNENVAGGWAGGVAPLLRGCAVESVQAVPDDRIIFFDLVSRSAFGVPARHRVSFELEPNKANILVLRPTSGARDGWHILAAAKEIEGSKGARDVLVGKQYELPPPRLARLSGAEFRRAVDAMDEADPRTISRLLGELDPTCSPALAREALARTAATPRAYPLSVRLLETWEALAGEVERAASSADGSVYVWRRGQGATLCHVVPLTWPAAAPEVDSSLNEVCAAEQGVAQRKRRAPAVNALRKRLSTMLERGAAEIASLHAAQQRAEDAERYREAGDAIYTYLAEIPDGAGEFVTPGGRRVELDPLRSAKANAADYFKRFKKARSGLPRIAQRLAVVQANRTYWEELLWQLDRAQQGSQEVLEPVSEEIAAAIGVRQSVAKRRAPRALTSRSFELDDGAVAYVGRSPKDNERVTFSVGGPDDLWFHARGIPGAHVILKLAGPRGRASDAQIEAAAALAAGHSRAAEAAKVEVDYTPRKHVRKQGGSRTGLVWYTDFKTILVKPRTS